ncbi:MAG: DUF6034 family protein [Lachnospiraceae bacterium]
MNHRKQLQKLAIIAAFSLTAGACQANPDAAVIADKGGDLLESRIQQTAETSAAESLAAETAEALNSESGADGQSTVINPMNVTHYEDSYPGAEDGVTIRIDAEVQVPKGKMPVIRVKPHEITSDEVKAWTQVLFDGNTAYEPDLTLTKGELEEMILQLKQAIGDEDQVLEDWNGDQEAADEAMDERKARIAYYESLYESAPSEKIKTETDWTFHPYSYYQEQILLPETDEEAKKEQELTDKTLCLKAETEIDGRTASISVSNRMESDYVLQEYHFYDDDAASAVPMMQTEEEAKAQAMELAERLGFDNWQIDSCRAEESHLFDDSKYYYTIDLIPCYEGVAVTRQAQLAGVNREDTGDSYAANYRYELLDMTISDGKIVSVGYESPLDIVDIENPDVAILSFDEIMDIFKNQMQLEYTKYRFLHYADFGQDSDEGKKDAEEIESAEATISDIRLGLARIRVKDNLDEYRLVPAWTFRGTEVYRTYGWEGELEPTIEVYTYAVINAIDGSLINVSRGY